jgi:hypothetical protein
MVELVKQNEVFPIGVFLEFPGPAIDGPPSLLVAGEDSDHLVGDFTRDLAQISGAISFTGEAELEGLTVASTQSPQRFDD